MLRPNRILLASDFSASAEAALCCAAALARQSQASLLMMHVIEPGFSSFARWTDVFRFTEAMGEIEAERTAAFEALASHPALAGLSVERVVKHGHAGDCITDMTPRVDLVVIGTGQGQGISAGATARQVAHASAAPVLLTPPDGGVASLPEAGAEGLSFKQVMLAIDLAGYAPGAIEHATALAADAEAALVALQVLDMRNISAYPVSAGEGLHHNSDALKVLLEKGLAEAVPDNPDGPPVVRRVIEGEATEVLAQQIEAQHADVVVLSAHPYGGLRKLFTQSTVDSLMGSARCPLLAVPLR